MNIHKNAFGIIWQYRLVGQGQRRFIIYANLVGPTPQCYMPSHNAIGLQNERPWLIGQRSALTFETYL